MVSIILVSHFVTIYVSVVLLLESNVSPPIQLLSGPSNLSELAGETVQLECAVSMPSSRDLHIIWTRQGKKLYYHAYHL